MKFETVDGTRRNIDKIAEMFPQVVTEVLGDDGKLKRAVKWDILKELLSGDYVEGGECYEFTWPGKRAAIAEAAKPIRKTLRPCKEESKNWDTTENLYIEGDNLEVLKLLQESYLGKVKMIYIDPPYNTGNDFVYKDNFTKDKDTSEDELGLFDEETDNRTMSGELFHNTESNGRFHSDWCSMIYPRLQIAKDLLAEDGVIFISIDDNEIDNLRKICNEIFGEENALPFLIRRAKIGGGSDNKQIAKEADFVVVYVKNIYSIHPFSVAHTEKDLKRYSQEDENGRYFWDTYSRSGLLIGDTESDNLYYEVTFPDGTTKCDRWRRSKDRLQKDLADGEAKFVQTVNGWNIHFKQRLNIDGKRPRQIIYDDMGNTSGKEAIRDLGLDKIFDYPKPVALSSFIAKIIVDKNAFILDFFSGSATTAHAVMQLNAEDGGKRKFIMVQLPEVCEEKSEAAKAGYKNICEIGKERIRRAGEKIKEEAGLAAANLDIGFRVFKVADSNMKDVYYSAGEYSQDMLDSLVSNIKEDRTDLDLLYGCLLEWGVELSLPHTSETIDNVTVHTVNNRDLIACFDANIPESAIRTIAKRQPLRAVFRDSSFSSAPQKINVEEIFKLLSPTTTVKVI